MKTTAFISQSSDLLRRLTSQRFDAASLNRLSQRLFAATAPTKFVPDETLLKLCYEFLNATARALPGHFSAIVPVGIDSVRIALSVPALHKHLERLSARLQSGSIQPDSDADEDSYQLYLKLDALATKSYQGFATETTENASLLDILTPTMTSTSPEVADYINSLNFTNVNVLDSFIEAVVYAQLYLYRYSMLAE